jgi:nitrogen fixation NifU-like protein
LFSLERIALDRDDDIEEFARRLQEQLMEQLRRTYGPVVIDHWQNPRNLRALDAPDGSARVKGVCGDSMEMSVRVRDEIITECAFQTDGCGTTVVCGSVATELALNKSFTEALAAVSAAEILKVLGGLPEESVHCAQLAAETLRRALADYLYRQSAASKKDHRKS